MTGAVDAFLAWAEHDRLRSPATIARYKVVLRQLRDPEHATLEDIEAWWLTRLAQAPATRANELACLRAFYRYCARYDLRPDDPTRRLFAPKVDNAYPRPIGRAELAAAFTLCDERDAPDLRRALALGAYGGLRVSEAAGLDWGSLDLDARLLRIRGKGRKERLAGLSPKLLDEILPQHRAGTNVVTGQPGPGYSPDSLQRRVNRLLAQVGDGLTFHKLRARYVTQGIAETGDIYAVSRAVGWASIETAKHYADLSDDSLQRIAAAASR